MQHSPKNHQHIWYSNGHSPELSNLMAVLPFRKPSAAAPAPTAPRTIAEQVTATPAPLSEEDLNGLLKLTEAEGVSGDTPISYTALLEVKVRRLVARFGMPRLPFTVDELDALMAYAAFLEGARADGLLGAKSWQSAMLAETEKHHPGYAVGLRLFIAENLEGLRAHHSTACGYAELIRYADEYY